MPNPLILIGYPTYIEIPPTEDPSKYGSYANVLIGHRDGGDWLVHRSFSLASDDFLSYVGMKVISDRRYQPRAATRRLGDDHHPRYDQSDFSCWLLTAGQGGHKVQSPLGIADVDPGILTEGKLRLVNVTILSTDEFCLLILDLLIT